MGAELTVADGALGFWQAIVKFTDGTEVVRSQAQAAAA
jgi:hypothetical protein